MRDTRANLTLTTRSILDVQAPRATDVYLTGDVATSPTAGRFRVTLANGTDSTHHYSVLLVRPQTNAVSVVGLSATINGVTRTGSNALVEFSAPAGLVPGSYRVRVVYSNRPLRGTGQPTVTNTFWATTPITL